MRALLVDPAVPGRLRLGEAENPRPAANEALVRVSAVSLNSGEVKRGIQEAAAGEVLGWDAAGVVERAAADGSGPAAGTPVVTIGPAGAWAELRAVNTDLIGIVPEGADLGAISTVPVAGGSALRALDRIGPLLGRRIVITGATGGVGRYAVQLARRGGAHVIACTGDPERHGESLTALGAHEVITAPAQLDEPVHGIVDTVGGQQLADGYTRLAEHGTLVSVGRAAPGEQTFPDGAFAGPAGHDRTLTTFYLLRCEGVGRDLTVLAGLVAAGELDANIAWRGPWQDVATATERLVDRRLHGKAVLDVV
ncbi:zinc-binding dehydrogenase [Amycolatopsis pithecellobii]|uniref:Zinc-binding dehydrogenase n=1 Tax=Amycolatopsis pithecellobii TaxID=664692 RepID=A0A6N7YQT8_9PSEU|nr:zinc-binding dehydrogenase [Amycolatopsis pithecellobii]MTD54258.1 zinc-binding dehydrogenase [Amycolatopsis pithecellobii]